MGVESEVGEGSAFWFELAASAPPVVPPAQAGNAAGLPATGPGESGAVAASAQRTLLYVEDNPANLALIERLIARRSDLKLVTAIDGYMGIQLARTYRPEVILMDINLPGLSGYEALQMLQADAATRHIPVLALSANAMPRDIERGLQAGFHRYLTKPVKVDELMQALDDALQAPRPPAL